MKSTKNVLTKLIILCVLFVFISANSIVAQEVSIFITRHAEKAKDNLKDPSLSELGLKRAQGLATFFKYQNIDLFYSTPYKRTIGTIKPLANQKGKEIHEYSPSNQKEFVEKISKMDGKTILISAHSNTIYDLLNKFTGTSDYKEIEESQFGDIWMVQIKDGKAKVFHFYLN